MNEEASTADLPTSEPPLVPDCSIATENRNCLDLGREDASLNESHRTDSADQQSMQNTPNRSNLLLVLHNHHESVSVSAMDGPDTVTEDSHAVAPLNLIRSTRQHELERRETEMVETYDTEERTNAMAKPLFPSLASDVSQDRIRAKFGRDQNSITCEHSSHAILLSPYSLLENCPQNSPGGGKRNISEPGLQNELCTDIKALWTNFLPPNFKPSDNGILELEPGDIARFQTQFRSFFYQIRRGSQAEHIDASLEGVADTIAAWESLLSNTELNNFAREAVPELRTQSLPHDLHLAPKIPSACAEANLHSLGIMRAYIGELFPVNMHEAVLRCVTQLFFPDQCAAEISSRLQQDGHGQEAIVAGMTAAPNIDNLALADRAFMRLTALFLLLNRSSTIDPVPLQDFDNAYRNFRQDTKN